MRVRQAFALSTLVASGSACSLLVSPAQCARDQDCVDKGAAFADTTCARGLCLPPTAAPDAMPADLCTSTAECIAQNGAHSVCLAGPGRRCASLTSEDCTTVLGDDASEDSLIFGMLVDTSIASADDFINGVELARNDFQQALAGVPGGPGVPPRPLLIVVCAEQENAQRAARHLVEEVQVPAIIGPTSSERLIDVANAVTVAASTLLMSPAASSDAVSSLADEGLVFRTAPSDFLRGRVMGLVTNQIATGSVRVATVATEDDLGKGIARGIESSLSLNGQTPAESQQYRVVSLPPAPSDQDLAEAAASVAQARPTLVLLAGGAEQASLPAAIEAVWPSTSSARPTYLVADSVATPDFLSRSASAPETQLARVRVVYPANDRSPVFQTFRRLLVSATSGMAQPFEAAKAYDATYVLALAAIPGSEGAPVTGRSLADAIPAFLLLGDRVEVGALGLTGVAARLSVQSIVDLEGASGPLEFDSRGDVETDFEIGCLDRDARDEVSVEPSELYYRAGTTDAAGSLQGTYEACAVPSVSDESVMASGPRGLRWNLAGSTQQGGPDVQL